MDSSDWTGKTTDKHHHRFPVLRVIVPIVLLVAVFALALAMGGCAKFTNPINQTEVASIGGAYGALQSAAVTYDGLPVCNEALGITKLCRTVAISALLAKYDAAFTTAYDRLEAFVRNPKNYPGLSLTQLYAAAWDGFNTFKAAELAYNIGKAS